MATGRDYEEYERIVRNIFERMVRRECPDAVVDIHGSRRYTKLMFLLSVNRLAASNRRPRSPSNRYLEPVGY